MAITKNAGTEGLYSERWLDLSKGPVTFQPVGPYYIVDTHSVKTYQGFYLPVPCALDDLGECRLHNDYPLRKVMLWTVWDSSDGKIKYLKLPKTGARQMIEMIEEEGMEPTTTIFYIARYSPNEKIPSLVAFQMNAEQTGQLPKESDLEDLYDRLLAWMEPSHLEHFVPKFKKLQNTKAPRSEGESGEAYVPIDDDLWGASLGV